MTLREVGRLTPDQAYFMLCGLDAIRSHYGKSLSAAETMQLAGPDGTIKARTRDGKTIERPFYVDGKSLAQRMWEAAARRKSLEKEALAKSKGRRVRGGRRRGH